MSQKLEIFHHMDLVQKSIVMKGHSKTHKFLSHDVLVHVREGNRANFRPFSRRQVLSGSIVQNGVIVHTYP